MLFGLDKKVPPSICCCSSSTCCVWCGPVEFATDKQVGHSARHDVNTRFQQPAEEAETEDEPRKGLEGYRVLAQPRTRNITQEQAQQHFAHGPLGHGKP